MQITMLLLLSQFFFWPSPIDWQMTQENVAVRGSVVDATSGHGVAGATVYAMSGALVERSTADSNGHFIFLTLLPGTYGLCASRSAAAVNCSPSPSEAQELFAGFEYGATVVLSPGSD
ncbi:MAG TPA: carboxypeptidase-like regulatory domain-containing protein [Candidatus Babeliales bacterium]|nr:carboxypeptidase-like regulatory domain-containing protein [Candidatus Babeliales bacterium]